MSYQYQKINRLSKISLKLLIFEINSDIIPISLFYNKLTTGNNIYMQYKIDTSNQVITKTGRSLYNSLKYDNNLYFDGQPILRKYIRPNISFYNIHGFFTKDVYDYENHIFGYIGKKVAVTEKNVFSYFVLEKEYYNKDKTFFNNLFKNVFNESSIILVNDLSNVIKVLPTTYTISENNFINDLDNAIADAKKNLANKFNIQ